MRLCMCAVWKYGLCMSAYNIQMYVCCPMHAYKAVKVGSNNKQLYVRMCTADMYVMLNSHKPTDT